MKKILMLIFSFGALMAMPPFSFAADSSIKTYPVQGIFVSNQNENKKITFDKKDEDTSFEINFMSDEFKDLIKYRQRDFFIPEFIKTYLANFQDTTSELTDKNKYKTIVSYISIPRASKYIVKKPNGNEIFLPLTTSLTFVNVLTGETIYSTSHTIYNKLLEDNYDQITEKYMSAYKDSLANVIEKSKTNFHPFEIPVKVIDIYKNLYILDKGSEVGIAEDDLLFDSNENQLSIIYSTLNYSIAKPVLGNDIKVNSVFAKQSNNGGINQIKKPKVLLINDMGNSSIYDLLITNLGDNSKINLLATNPTFNEMRKTVVDINNNFKSTNIVPKNLPDYFLLFNFTPPVKTAFKQNQSGLDSIYYQMLGCGTMFDKTGKVVFSKCADDKTEPRFSNQDYGTSEADITGILFKNLIAKISQQINAQIEFREYEFKIKQIENNEIVIEDKSEILSEGDVVTIFKSHKVNGNEYLIPEFKYNVITVSKGLATCSLDYPYNDNIEKPSKSDVAKSSMIVSAGGANFYKVDISNMKLSDSNVTIKHLDKFITPIIGTSFKKPLSLDNTTIEDKMNAVNGTLMFRDKLNISKSASDSKVIPYYSAVLKKHKVKGYTKIDTYKLTVGIKISEKGKIVADKSVNQDITITLPLKNDEPTLQIELIKVIYPTMQQLIGNLK